MANSLAAVRAGARQIQGTLNGLGERCGNANLTSIIPTLMLKSDYADRFETGVTDAQMQKLTHASRILDEILNRAPTGTRLTSARRLRHKGGIHVSAVQKDPRTYEHVPRKASATGASCSSRTRPGAPTSWPSSSASASPWPRTIRASRRLLER